MGDKTNAEILRTAIHEVLIKNYPKEVLLVDIYTMVREQVQLTEADWDPLAVYNRQPSWQRNIRNVLQRDMNKKLVQRTRPEHYKAREVLCLHREGSSERFQGDFSLFKFVFVPGSSREGKGTVQRKAIEETLFERKHRILQEKLYNRLVDEYGKESVAEEHPIAYWRADILVQEDDGYTIYEIKTSKTSRECIKEALGQLLIYGFWTGLLNVKKFVVVGEPQLDSFSEQFLETLNKKHNIPIGYLSEADK